MEEGLLLSEGWAPSNEAVCSTESCLAVAHSSELLQLPGCQKPSIVPDSPAGLRAIQTVKKPNLYPVPLHREKTEASPLDHERNSQVLFPARLEEGFLGQPREQVRGWWGAEPGETPLKSYCVLSPPREGRSEAASIGWELSKYGPQTCCGASSGSL